MNEEQIQETLRLARMVSTANVRRYAVDKGLGGPRETDETVKKRIEKAKAELETYLRSIK